MDTAAFKQKLAALVAEAVASDVTIVAVMHALNDEIEGLAGDIMTKQLRDREDAYNRGEREP